MKIAEAFIEQKHLLNKMMDITDKIHSSHFYKNSKKRLDAMLQDMNQYSERYEELCYDIDETNLTTEVDGVLLQDLIIEYQLLKDKYLLYSTMLKSIPFKGECLYTLLIDVNAMTSMRDIYFKKMNDLYTKLKVINWNMDLKNNANDNK